MNFDEVAGVAALVLVALLILSILSRIRIRLPRRRAWLDRQLLRWNDKCDEFTRRDLVSHVFWAGATGSGKTSSAETLQEQIVADKCCGMLVMGAKPEDRDRFLALAKRHRRKVRVFGPGHPLRFNVMEYLGEHGGDARSITRCLMTVSEGLNEVQKDGETLFWQQNSERLLLLSVTALLVAHRRLRLDELQRFILSHAETRAAMLSEQWKSGFQNQTLELAFKRATTQSERVDLKQAELFWCNEWPSMPEKTRGSILTGVTTILSVFNSGDVATLLCGESNFSIEELLDGALIYVDASPTTYGQVGIVLSSTLKYLAQWRILQRNANRKIAVIWIDEFQMYVNSFDADFLAQARSHLGAMVCLTQGTQALIAKLRDEPKAKSLLTGFNHRVLNSLGSYEDSVWACQLIGERKQTGFGGSISPPTSTFESVVFTTQRVTTSFHQNLEFIVEPRLLMNGMRRGGEVNDCIVDAVVVRTGQAFSNGENHLFVQFKQKG